MNFKRFLAKAIKWRESILQDSALQIYISRFEVLVAFSLHLQSKICPKLSVVVLNNNDAFFFHGLSNTVIVTNAITEEIICQIVITFLPMINAITTK